MAAAAAKQPCGLSRGCGRVEIWPLKTNAAFLARAAADEAYLAGDVDTGFIERRAEYLLPAADPPAEAFQAAARALVAVDPGDPWSALTGFRPNADPDRGVRVQVGGISATVGLNDEAADAQVAAIDGEQVVFARGGAWLFSLPQAEAAAAGEAAGDGAILSAMPGIVTSVEVAAGDRVQKRARLLIVEAMKTELTQYAPFDGVVTELNVEVGDQVSEGSLLVRIEKLDD